MINMKQKKIKLNISDDTLDFYDDWFETFQAKQ